MLKKLLLLLGGLAGIVLLYVNLARPGNYEDCVLKNMPQPSGDLSATYFAQSQVKTLCRDKFPSEPSRSAKARSAKTRSLNASELGKITGQGGVVWESGGDFRATLYNGNGTLTITKVEIQVTTIKNHESSSRAYFADAYILPKSTSTIISFAILHGDDDAKLPWSIVSAEGFEADK